MLEHLLISVGLEITFCIAEASFPIISLANFIAYFPNEVYRQKSSKVEFPEEWWGGEVVDKST